MKANTPAERLVNGIIKENPTFVQVDIKKESLRISPKTLQKAYKIKLSI